MTTHGTKTPGAAGQPLHRYIADALRRRITRGVLAGGSKLPALRAIADEFQVSTMSVRRAIDTLEREGLVHRIAGVGAFVRPSPPPPATGRKMLAFVATDLSSPFETGIARGVERECQERAWALQILDARHDARREAANVQRLLESGPWGAVILPTCNDSRCVEALFKVQAAGFPVVVVDRTPPGLRTDLVESDHEGGAYRATKYLLDHGHAPVLMLTPPPEVSSIAARIHGYERALRDAGREPVPEWKVWLDLELQDRAFRENRKWLGGYQAMLPILRKHAGPLAVLAVDAYTAWGVYEACRELNLVIPRDVSVVGFDDAEIALAMRPPITIIAQRTEEIGRAAVALLEQRLAAGAAEQGSRRTFTHMVIDVDLIERESVASVRGEESRGG